jgi:hypothetical protein
MPFADDGLFPKRETCQPFLKKEKAADKRAKTAPFKSRRKFGLAF